MSSVSSGYRPLPKTPIFRPSINPQGEALGEYFLLFDTITDPKLTNNSSNADEWRNVGDKYCTIFISDLPAAWFGVSGTTNEWEAFDNRNNPMPLRERYGGILEEKEDFIPKKKMKYHTLEEPIEYYSENEAEDELIHLEDEGCGCDTACNCYDTTIYD